MNGFGPPDDRDSCDCTYGKFCAYHAEQSRKSSEAYREQAFAEGWNPDGNVDEDLAEVMMTVETSPALSENQKVAIRRILFPLRGRP
jgi:hypothetical protein